MKSTESTCKMAIDKCRVCGNAYFEEPLLTYVDMPKGAQYLPDAETLNSDKGVELTVCQCSACGLVQLNNDPVPYFREVIRAAGISKEMREFRIKQFSEFIENYSLERKKVIEIGCGRGEYLDILNNFNLDAHGLEFSLDSVNRCLAKNLQVKIGFVESENQVITDAPFDGFLILNFLEHLPDPNATLKGIEHNLSDGGVGLIEVPNFDMILKKNLFSEFIGDHLFYFTKDTLFSTLNRNGLEIIECREVWHDYILSVIVRKRQKLEIASFIQQRKELRAEISKFINRFEEKKVAVWGAGHQALAIISLTGIAHKIKYVIDSASFKQGKFTPATHIPIVAPENLNTDSIDAVIIMAASYSDEIANIIRNKFNKAYELVILRDFGLEEIK